jgi:hypothetical protein
MEPLSIPKNKGGEFTLESYFSQEIKADRGSWTDMIEEKRDERDRQRQRERGEREGVILSEHK